MSATRFNLSPNDVDVSDTKIFISYKTKEWEYAKKLSEELRNLGFGIIIVPPQPSSSPKKKNEDIKTYLSELIDDADYICIIVSEMSLMSAWVQYEFKEAASLIGRVVFVNKDNTQLFSGYEAVDYLQKGFIWRNLYVKHSTLTLPEITNEGVNELAIQLLNDPDEGWYDGRVSVGRRCPAKGLRYQNRMKKYARECVLVDPKYEHKYVLEVIPFNWSQIECDKEDMEAVLKSIILDRGLLNLERSFLNDEVDIFQTWYFVTEFEEFLEKDDFGLNVFVVLER
ncbi:MAG: toll/interleukin-1 receptor domain-containing protein [Methanocellales archaeon]|nr:toll/interleukin-1 receptor domain-containing protein [Methanocellales archaeon]MDD3290995.1 toll/interleukin-1 receptor domain-containing protein [Methanocellales archaeon]MDD5234880.1 toll/interleukin-1 receptor domain-containing protein [Methanocellales archaeon]MDD5484750.1 toll/interleukin-1 receptor domain-containing protein [Methanocellales archaeon]